MTTAARLRWIDDDVPHPSAELVDVLGDDLLHSPWVRRLESISFLGTLDHHPKSVSKPSRLDHSIGVAQLGLNVARELGATSKQTREFVVACLLHDVGHYPYSHSVEGAFKRVTGADHHDLTMSIILGGELVSRHRSLAPLLERTVDVNAVASLVAGGPTEHPLSDLLIGTINVDTLDGICRAARSFALLGVPTVPNDVFVVGPAGISIPAIHLSVVDEFWLLKERVYETVVNAPSNVLFELELSMQVEALAPTGLIENFLAFTDDVFRERFLGGASRRQFDRFDDTYIFSSVPGDGAQLRRTRKRYWVNADARTDSGFLPRGKWRERYRHTKDVAYLVQRIPAEGVARAQDSLPPEPVI